MRTIIKQDLNQDLNFQVYAMVVVLENKTNTTSHPNIGSLKTATEQELYKISEEFYLNRLEGVLK